MKVNMTAVLINLRMGTSTCFVIGILTYSDWMDRAGMNALFVNFWRRNPSSLGSGYANVYVHVSLAGQRRGSHGERTKRYDTSKSSRPGE